jgi:ribonuclease-3
MTVSLKFVRLQKQLGYQFAQPQLCLQALTHRSVSSKTNYERLEFMGDALLGVIIACYLYERFPSEDEGRLTRLRSTLVRQDSLAEIAKDLKLGEHLILGSGEMKSGGHRRESILADAVEAIIGAIYLDSSDLNIVRDVVLKWYEPYLDTLEPKDTLKDPKTRLQELLQGKHLSLPEYTLTATQGEAHNQTFTVQCRVDGAPITVGLGHSRRYAEQSAASQLLAILEVLQS